MNNLSEPNTLDPSKEQLLAKAASMYPILRERADQTAADRKVPKETIEELEVAGFFDVTKPREFGGYEMPYHEFCEIIMELAKGCPSTAWVYAVMGEHNQSVGAYFPMEALQEVWGEDRSTRIASGNAPGLQFERTDGGWLMNGQLRFSSACDHCSWHMTGGLIDGKPSKFIFRRGDAEIIDTWHVMGMEGTGSRDIKLTDVFVADNCIVPANHYGPKSKDAPLFRQPQWSTNPYSLASAIVGAAQGALDIYIAYIRERTPRMGGGFKIGELQSIQMRIAESAAEIDSAKRMILGNLRETHDLLLRNEEVSKATMSRNKRDMAYAANLAKKAIDRIFYASGAQSIYLDQDIQRFYRDVQAGAQQVFLDWDVHATTYGRVALDLETPNTRW